MLAFERVLPLPGTLLEVVLTFFLGICANTCVYLIGYYICDIFLFVCVTTNFILDLGIYRCLGSVCIYVNTLKYVKIDLQ